MALIDSLPCILRTLATGKSPKFLVNAALWTDSESEQVEDYARPQVFKLLAAALQRLRTAPMTAQRADQFQAAFERLSKSAWSNLRGFLLAIQLTVKPTGLTTLRNVRTDVEGRYRPVCLFCMNDLKQIRKRKNEVEQHTLQHALRQGQDHFDFMHKKSFSEFKVKFVDYENEFLVSAYGDAMPAAAPNVNKWAESVIIANTKQSY